MSTRPTYGVLVDWLEDEYQNNVLAGVEDGARKLGVNLIIFAGGVLRSPHFGGAHRNFIYDLVGKENVSGLVVMAGAIGNYVGRNELSVFCERFRPLPMCSVGIELDGMPCVLVDNQRGMRNLVVHLIQVHGYRRLAFIRGPRVNSEAEGRYRVYREVLSEYGIPLDPDLITEGDFQTPSGVEAIRTLHDERGVQFDAVVAADDAMALGAMEALRSRGIRVPYDVAVVGFDDIEAARFATCPLSTVRQPLHEQGIYAMQTVLAQSRGEPVDDRIVLRTQFAVRQSCGCPSQSALSLAPYERAESTESLQDTLASRRKTIVQDIAQAMRSLSGGIDVAWAERLLDALVAELKRKPEGVFLSTFDEVLTTAAALGGNVTAWQGAISVLRHHARACEKSDPEATVAAEELWHQARAAIGNVAERAQGQLRLQSERWTQTIRATGEVLTTALDVGTLAKSLLQELPRLKIPSCHVALFEGDARPAEEARLAVVYDAQGDTGGAASGDLFAPFELGPPGLLQKQRRTTQVLQPVFFEREQLGFAMFELGPSQGMVSEHLRDQLSGALKSAMLFEQLVEEGSRPTLTSSPRPEPAAGVAARLQTAALPKRFDVPGMQISAALVPASETGGDYYDVLPVEDGCWLAMGDVDGQGLDAALAVVTLQSTVSAVCGLSPTGSPRELLAQVNTHFYDNARLRLEGQQQADLTLVRCDTKGRIVFAGANQEVIICRAADGKCERLPTTGPRLGEARELGPALDDTEDQLKEGDLLVLYTDGAVQARNENDESFGVERLCTEVQGKRQAPVEEIRDHVLQVIGRFVAVQRDDLSLLVARYGAAPETPKPEE